MKTFLITGAAGFIGSNMADRLIKEGHKVIGVDNLSVGKLHNLPIHKHFKFYELDICNEPALNLVFSENKIDVVMHFAGNASIVSAMTNPVKDVNNNIVTTMNVVNACIKHKVNRLLHASTMVVYGANNVNKKETDVVVPTSTYGLTKYAGERYVINSGERKDLEVPLNVTAFRMFNCYSSDTEILTNNGFKLFKDLDKKDLVATLNDKLNTVEYQKPTASYKIQHNGDMYNFKSQSHDLFVTPDHPMLIRDRELKHKFKRINAKEMFENQNKYYNSVISRQTIKWLGKSIERYVIPEVKTEKDRNMNNKFQNGNEKNIFMYDWMSFLGWFISEGSVFKTGRRYSVVISQYKQVNPRNHEDICKLVKRMGFNPYITDKEIQINSKQLYEHIKKLFPTSGSHNKFIPRQFLALDYKYLSNLYDAIMRGDGSKIADGYRRYSTVSKQLSNDVCELMFKLGIPSSVIKEICDKGCGFIYRVDLNKSREFPQLGNNRTKKIYCEKKKYNDFVYDVTVPNHIIYVRRNGKSCWASNCYGPKQSLNNPYQGVVAIFMGNVKRKENITIHGDGKQTRDFIYIDDVLDAWIKSIDAVKTYGQVFNLGNGKELSIGFIANEVMKKMDSILVFPITINYLSSREGDIRRCVSNSDKLKEVIKWKPKVSFEEGLNKFIEHVRS